MGPITPKPPPHQGHNGEDWNAAVDRLGDDAEDPFDRHAKSRGRMGWKDLPHAIANIPVTLARQYPWLAGHIGLWLAIAVVVLIAMVIILALI